MGEWEELTKEDYERNSEGGKFEDLSLEKQIHEIHKLKSRMVYRLNILTDAFYGEGCFGAVYRYPADFNEEQVGEHLKKFYDRQREIEENINKYQKSIEELKKKIASGELSGVFQEDANQDIIRLESKQKECEKEYNRLYKNLEPEEEQRFVELNEFEKELFDLLLRKIPQDKLEKAKYDKWEDLFSLDERNRIVDLLWELDSEEHWKPIVGELDVEVISFRLLFPKEYRVLRMLKMLCDENIPQELRNKVLNKIDKNIYDANKKLSKHIRARYSDAKGSKEEKDRKAQEAGEKLMEPIWEKYISRINL